MSYVSFKALYTVEDFYDRWTLCKIKEGTTLQLLISCSKKGPMYHLLVGISVNVYPFSDIPIDTFKFSKKI